VSQPPDNTRSPAAPLSVKLLTKARRPTEEEVVSRRVLPHDPKSAKQRLEETLPVLRVGDAFAGGTVIAIKPSLQSGWWLEVRDEDGMVKTYPAAEEATP